MANVTKVGLILVLFAGMLFYTYNSVRKFRENRWD